MFKDESTYKNDYKVPKLLPPKRYHAWTRDQPRKPDKILKQKPYEAKYVQTMTRWHDSNGKVPFDLMIEPKPIIQTHPNTPFEKLDPELVDPLKEEIIKTRPRLYMTPAVSMDDITDREVRDLLCKNMYTTVWEEASSEIKHTFTKHEIPNNTFEKCGNPLKEQFWIFKTLPAGWKAIAKDWETKQYTALVDPTKAFWSNYKHSLNTPVGPDPFAKTITDETRQEIRDLIEKDELRMAYDKLKPGYAGHVPRNVTGPLRKQELTAKK